MIAEATSDAPFSVAALLALVVLLGGALAWWQRTRGALAGGDGIRLVSVRALGGKRLLALVEVENERFLLGLTDERIACLARLDAPADAVPPAAARDSRGDGTWRERRA
jgi:flagellar biogenesis protein FliO